MEEENVDASLDENHDDILTQIIGLREDLKQVRKSRWRDRGVVGLVALLSLFTLYFFVQFKADINDRGISSCKNFNSDTIDKRLGLKTLIRGITPANLQSSPEAQAGFAVFDSFINNSWKFRDCSDSGIVSWRKSNSNIQVECRPDNKGFCFEPIPGIIPQTPTTTGGK